MKVAVLGMGSWGCALAQVLATNQHDVVIWGRDPQAVQLWNTEHRNHYLPDALFDPSILATTDLQEAVSEARMIVVVIPTQGIRQVMKQLKPLIDEAENTPLITHATKGLEPETHLRISQMIAEELTPGSYSAIAVLSGPSHAEEVVDRQITTVAVASVDLDACLTVQEAFMNRYFRVYTNQDVVGVELGGALKNIIAIGAGIVDGLQLGDNVKAALITRGLAEITRLGVELGADPLTFMGLSGMGDLIVTCISVHSRNYRAGRLFAQGMDYRTAQQEVGMVVEGIVTCKAAYQLAQSRHVEMPLTEGLYQLIYQNASLSSGIDALMDRAGRAEASLIDHLFNTEMGDMR